MNTLESKTGVWFIYDGDCPICAHAAQAFRIKEKLGAISTLNAREATDDPLIQTINELGLDLDEGMAIYFDKHFYHGKEALAFMAKHGKAENAFMSFIKSLFWSDTLSRVMYPWMRGLRNWLLRRKKVGRIDNLSLRDEPIFKSVFGKDWDKLPPIMQKHYANHPYQHEVNSVKGNVDVYCKPPLLWFAPVMKLLSQVPAFNENDVSITVDFESDLNTKAFHFKRCFYFANKKPYHFRSRMLPIKNNELVEIMALGLCWRMQVFWDGEKVILAHKGYALHLFGHFIPLPLTYILSAGNAEEHPVDDNTFDMEVNITHPWWGNIYGYKGRFEVTN